MLPPPQPPPPWSLLVGAAIITGALVALEAALGSVDAFKLASWSRAMAMSSNMALYEVESFKSLNDTKLLHILPAVKERYCIKVT